MPNGHVAKVVHLSLQSSRLADTSPQSKGYGFVVDESDNGAARYYFDAKALTGYLFEDLQAGQKVEFQTDAKQPIAKSVKLIEPILSAPEPKVTLP